MFACEDDLHRWAKRHRVLDNVEDMMPSMDKKIAKVEQLDLKLPEALFN